MIFKLILALLFSVSICFAHDKETSFVDLGDKEDGLSIIIEMFDKDSKPANDGTVVRYWCMVRYCNNGETKCFASGNNFSPEEAIQDAVRLLYESFLDDAP